MSPTAQSFSPARSHSSVSTTSASGSTPTVSRPMPDRLLRRPAATSSLSAVTCWSPRSSVKVPSSWATDPISTPVRTWTPSAANACSRRSAASGSSCRSSRSAASTIVTRTPNRAKTWANSQPIGPPPSTTTDAGSSVSATASRLVQYGVSASPSIGGALGVGAGVEHHTARGDVRRVPDHDAAGTVETTGAAHEADARVERAGRRPPCRPSRRWPRPAPAGRPGTSPAGPARRRRSRRPGARPRRRAPRRSSSSTARSRSRGTRRRPGGSRPRPRRGRPAPA